MTTTPVPDSSADRLIDDLVAAGLVDRIAPALARRLMTTPSYQGAANRVHVGASVSLVNTLFNTSSGDIVLGDFVSFGHGVHVLAGTHRFDVFDHERQLTVPAGGHDVVIERGAWIASGATVLGPCRIGAHAVVGAGSVVTGDVRAGWFYAGVPARPIRPVHAHFAPSGGIVRSVRRFARRIARSIRRLWT